MSREELRELAMRIAAAAPPLSDERLARIGAIVRAGMKSGGR